AVGGAARLRQAVREQELRILHQPLEPFLLQVARRQTTQQHRYLPVLHQLVGEPGIAARDLFRDERKGLYLARLVELDPAELLRNRQGADADRVRSFQDVVRQALLRRHVPLALPVAADKRNDDVVDEGAAALPHQALLFGKSLIVHERVSRAGRKRSTRGVEACERAALAREKSHVADNMEEGYRAGGGAGPGRSGPRGAAAS